MKGVRRGARVLVPGDPEPWIVLDRHPEAGTWWLHRWVGDQWQSTHSASRAMRQLFR